MSYQHLIIDADDKPKFDYSLDKVFGITVASVVSSVPVSPIDNTMYLMSNDAASHAKAFAYYDAVKGWQYYSPYNGATVFDTERGIYLDYVDSQWVTRVDTLIRGTVTIPSGTSTGTWTSSHIQFNGGDPMMLNVDDLMMLQCDYKLVGRRGVERSFLHRSNRIDVAPEYLMHSYADDVDHGTILDSNASLSYVNIEGETVPDKSGILFAEIVIEITVSPIADLEIEYDIRLKGTIIPDAGTWDC